MSTMSSVGLAGVSRNTARVFGRSAFDSRFPAPQRYPARQTLEACQAVARLHGLGDEGVVYAQQTADKAAGQRKQYRQRKNPLQIH